MIEIVPNPNLLLPGSGERTDSPMMHHAGSGPQRPTVKVPPHDTAPPHGHTQHPMMTGPPHHGPQTGGKDQPTHQGLPPQNVPPHLGIPGHYHQGAYPHGVMVSQSPTTTQSPAQQTSELRAALATPSKLVQQEQLLQQQRLQKQQQQHQQQQQQQQQQQHMRPLTPLQPEQQPSPGAILGLHRSMPFTFQEQRSAGSRAEPKVASSTEQQFREVLHKDGRVPTSANSVFNQPLAEQRPAGVPGHPESRAVAFYGDLRFQHPVVPYPGTPMGIGMSPRPLGMDPRMMFPGTQHHEYQTHMVPPGMMPQHPQHFVPQHHQQSAPVDQILQERPSSARPLSRTTPPSAQPSPRATPTPVQHTTQGVMGPIPTALTQHPSLALNSLMMGGTPQEVPHPADNLYMILRVSLTCPLVSCIDARGKPNLRPSI